MDFMCLTEITIEKGKNGYFWHMNIFFYVLYFNSDFDMII